MAKSPEYIHSRFNLSGNKPLFYPDDNPLICELIKELIERKRFVRRESKHHIKHRKLNYFPSTEVVTIDGTGRHPETGPDAFLELVEEMYPRRRQGKPDPLSIPEEQPQSSLVLDIILESEDGFVACADDHTEVGEDTLPQ